MASILYTGYFFVLKITLNFIFKNKKSCLYILFGVYLKYKGMLYMTIDENTEKERLKMQILEKNEQYFNSLAELQKLREKNTLTKEGDFYEER